MGKAAGGPSIAAELATSGFSVAFATMCTNPLDVIKTRMQLARAATGAAAAAATTPAAAAAAAAVALPVASTPASASSSFATTTAAAASSCTHVAAATRGGPAGAGGGVGASASSSNSSNSSSSSRSTVGGAARRLGLVETGVRVVREEGVAVLWSGAPAGMFRGLTYGGLRLGLYTPIKAALAAGHPDGQLSFAGKAAAGIASGGLAGFVSSPLELVKTRLQAQGNPHRGVADVVRAVVAADGVVGLWRGAVPGTMRAAALTASQLATYDQVKRAVVSSTGWGDDVRTHLLSSLISGLATTTVCNPVDLLKTLMFTSGRRSSGGGGSGGGLWHCAAEVMRTDGLGGFMRGWSANYVRLGPQTVITLLTAEQLRKLTGLGQL